MPEPHVKGLAPQLAVTPLGVGRRGRPRPWSGRHDRLCPTLTAEADGTLRNRERDTQEGEWSCVSEEYEKTNIRKIVLHRIPPTRKDIKKTIPTHLFSYATYLVSDICMLLYYCLDYPFCNAILFKHCVTIVRSE